MTKGDKRRGNKEAKTPKKVRDKAPAPDTFLKRGTMLGKGTSEDPPQGRARKLGRPPK